MPDDRVDAAYSFIINACTECKITSGVARKHQRSVGVTFNATQDQWRKFYDVITDKGYEIQGVRWNEVGKSKNQPIYFYDFTVKIW